MNIKAIIAEDEQKNRENLRQLLLKHCPGIDIIDCCSSAAEAYEIIVSLQPELVFWISKCQEAMDFHYWKTCRKFILK